jgi:hypothetical protein
MKNNSIVMKILLMMNFGILISLSSGYDFFTPSDELSTITLDDLKGWWHHDWIREVNGHHNRDQYGKNTMMICFVGDKNNVEFLYHNPLYQYYSLSENMRYHYRLIVEPTKFELTIVESRMRCRDDYVLQNHNVNKKLLKWSIKKEDNPFKLPTFKMFRNSKDEVPLLLQSLLLTYQNARSPKPVLPEEPEHYTLVDVNYVVIATIPANSYEEHTTEHSVTQEHQSSSTANVSSSKTNTSTQEIKWHLDAELKTKLGIKIGVLDIGGELGISGGYAKCDTLGESNVISNLKTWTQSNSLSTTHKTTQKSGTHASPHDVLCYRMKLKIKKSNGEFVFLYLDQCPRTWDAGRPVSSKPTKEDALEILNN